MQPLEQHGLRIRGLHKRFGQQSAVVKADLDVEPGRILALVGPSGCGKTTLLRLISGFETPDDGAVWIGGREVTSLTPDRRSVRMVFQAAMLYPFLTVKENLLFPRRSQHTEADRLFGSVCDLLRLKNLLNRRPRGLSGGETQRVALGRALLSKADVLLMDEPLSDVDPLLARQIRHALRALLVEQGRTVLYVTHDQEEATAIGDLVAVMAEGRIHQVGNARELFETPRTQFVAAFIAAGMPLFSAKVHKHENVTTLSSAALGLTLEVPSDLSDALGRVETVVVGLRGVEPLLQEPLTSTSTLRGKVVGLEQGFERQVLRVSTPAGIWRLPIPIIPSLQFGQQLVGDEIPMSLTGVTAHVFSDDGASLGRFRI